MTKKKIKANELTEADVQFISLVPKGANRIPLRILKEEGKVMIKGFEGLFNKEVSESYVASFLINKGANIEEAKARISKIGFSITDVEEKEGMTVFHQKTVPEDLQHQYVLKINDDMGVHIVCTKSLHLDDFETMSFRELFNKAGVLPNIFMAHDILKEVIMNILFSKDINTSKDASKKVKKALNEFSDMVVSMVEQIPISAFKIDDPKLIEKVKKDMEKDTKKKEDSSDEEAENVKKNNEEDSKDASKKEEESKENTEKSESEGGSEEADAEEEEASEEDDAEEVEKSEAKKSDSKEKKDDLSEIVETLKTISKEINTLKDSVLGLEGMKDTLSDLKSRVEDVSEIAKSADEAINGVTNTEPEDDRSVSTKSEKEPVKELRDTGYSRATC